MEEKNTREVIMQVALTLFATKGYAAVSMRDIASEAGIRASTIYHYFSGKQELFDELVQKAKEVKDGLSAAFMQVLGGVGVVEQEAFVQAGIFFVTGYLRNPQIEPLIKVLECERFHNDEADKAWRELMILAPMEHEMQVFAILKERGELKDENIHELTAEYQAAVLLAYFTGDMEQLQKQLHRFYERTFKYKGN